MVNISKLKKPLKPKEFIPKEQLYASWYDRVSRLVPKFVSTLGSENKWHNHPLAQIISMEV